MNLSIDDSIRSLKTEILSQDWTLPKRKIEPLEAAFSCLKARFKSRKSALAILSMADGILAFARKREEPVPPDFVDFLKEAMAHVVNMYEDGRFEPEKDAELCSRMYVRFNRLKEKAREVRRVAEPGFSPHLEPTLPSEQLPPLPLSPPPVESLESEEGPDHGEDSVVVDMAKTVADDGPEETAAAPVVEPGICEPSVAPTPPPDQPLENWSDQGDGVAESAPVDLPSEELDATGPTQAETEIPEQSPDRRGAESTDQPLADPATPEGSRKAPGWAVVRSLAIGEIRVGIAEKYVALVKPLSSRERAGYIRKSQIPLKDLGGLFRSLSKQMHGPLAQLGDRKLKRLILPLMIPQGVGLPPFSVEQAGWLVIVSNGQWHGVFFADRIEEQPGTLASFAKELNGDIAGKGCFAEGGEILLLNTHRILEREGFLALP